MKGMSSLTHEGSTLRVDTKVLPAGGLSVAKSNGLDLDVHCPPLPQPDVDDYEEEDDANNDATTLEVAPSWQEEPVHLPTYTPSTAAAQQDLPKDSLPNTPIDDPIHLSGSRKHFGFSARQSVASSIFPWQKHKPAVVFHQYSPYRPPLSKRSSLTRLKRVLPIMRADLVKHLEDEELDLL